MQLEKNIYRIEKLGIDGSDINEILITYTGEGNLNTATNLVVYSNIFQDNKLFCREYEEIAIISSAEFVQNKKDLVAKKFAKKVKRII